MKPTMHQLTRHFLLLLTVSALVAGCAPNVPLQSQQSMQESGQKQHTLPESRYLQAEAQGKNILRVDSAKSLVAFEVRRDGPFAKLGHDHVVASHDVKGFVAPDENTADLQVRMDQLVVDEAPLRAEAGFDTQPTADDIAGTRRNMLLHVLEAERYPYAAIHIERKDANSKAAKQSGKAILDVAITLHGTTKHFDVPATVETTAAGMIVSGSMHFNQTDFGMTPYSILNGAIRVADRLDMRFHVVAEKRES
ncbi:MAG TPA: YceI family protein [Oxalicibacterium sp.]|uniref:YceI family protein n=1 Tax=Oxalicibacterium sp. TaxID=2766525 RepID=UPI002C0CDF3F|nr:YceI family protein [Oxalicibacterium sp.]HWU98076.1 YceI family protein [Oxalicibacterium sp.]